MNPAHSMLRDLGLLVEDMRPFRHEEVVHLLVVLVRSNLLDLDHQAVDIGCASLLARWPS